MIKPLPGYVLIAPIEDEQITSGGIAVPETSKDKPSKGKVIGVGDTIKRLRKPIRVNKDINVVEDCCEDVYENCPVKINQTVIYKKWTNQEVEHKGKKYLLVKFDELLGVIE